MVEKEAQQDTTRQVGLNLFTNNILKSNNYVQFVI